MNNPRIPVVIMVVSLVAVAIIAARTFERSLSAMELRQANVAGLADLNRVAVSGPRIPGFADLNRVETRGPQITGFADLNRVDSVGKMATNATASEQAASQPQQITGFADLNRIVDDPERITGFADLNRVEAQAVLPLTGANPDRVCPHQSSPAGERDAGASAPAYVLQAKGCPVGGNE